MVTRALWKAEALICALATSLHAYGSCRVSEQGTTLRASDLRNARVTILNPFTKHWGCWCPGAKAHQFPLCWLHVHRNGPVSYKNSAVVRDNISK